jgi:hypothetical protein
MDRQYIRDNQVIERYLQGRLTADEETAFEEAYIGDPDLFQELKTASLLRRGLELHDADESGEEPPSSMARATAAPRYAIAASLVAGIALAASAYLFVENSALRGETAGSGITAGARVVPLVAVRGSEPNRIDAIAANDWTVLLVDPGFTPYERYSATLVRRSGDSAQELLDVDGLTPSYEGQLAVVVPSRLLTPGEYDVVLAARMRDWPEGRVSDDLGRTTLIVDPAP